MTTWKIVFVAAMLFSAPVIGQTPSDVEMHRRLGRVFTGADAAWREVASKPRITARRRLAAASGSPGICRSEVTA